MTKVVHWEIPDPKKGGGRIPKQSATKLKLLEKSVPWSRREESEVIHRRAEKSHRPHRLYQY